MPSPLDFLLYYAYSVGVAMVLCVVGFVLNLACMGDQNHEEARRPYRNAARSCIRAIPKSFLWFHYVPRFGIRALMEFMRPEDEVEDEGVEYIIVRKESSSRSTVLDYERRDDW